jgi:hypothetical protein
MTFWFDDPSILIKKEKITSIWPSKKQNLTEKLNSITRLIVILTIGGLILTRNINILVSSVITLVVIVIIYKSKKNDILKKNINKKEGYENLNTEIKKQSLVNSNNKNPLMNVLLTDIEDNPTRKDAAPSFNKKIKNMIKENTKKIGLDNKLFQDLGENINYERNFNLDKSMQRFYTTANSRVANNQTAFAKYCYGNMLSCKDGDSLQCEKNQKRWVNY